MLKRFARLFLVLLAFLVPGWPLAGSAANYPADILLGYLKDGVTLGQNDNPHNLSANASHSGPKASTETRICIFCHTPHGSQPQTQLWNRNAPATMGTFPLYNTAEVDEIAIDDAAINATTQYEASGAYGEYPNGATKMCLSCHDGATAIGEMFDGTVITMTAGNTYITDPNMILSPDGTTPAGSIDFRTTHPVSFVYTQDVVNYIELQKAGENYDVPWTGSAGNWKDEDIRLDAQQRMQCTTCHDPHADTRRVSGYGLPFWANFDGSGNDVLDYDNTCNKCHISPDGSGSGGTGHPITPLP